MRMSNFVGPTFQARSKVADAERAINWYPERQESPGAKAPWIYYTTPGAKDFASVTESPGRGLFTHQGRLFAVIGFKLYELSATGVATDRGDIVADGNPATFAVNGDAGNQMLFSSGDKGYLLNLTSNALTNPVNDVTMVDYLDGYFLALDAPSSTLKISNRLAGQTWQAGQIAQRTAGSDRWQAMKVLNRDIWLIGSRTGEVWYNSGVAPFPFVPIDGAFFKHGIGAGFSLCEVGDSLMWLGEDANGSGEIWRAGGITGGYVPVRVSTHAVEHAIQGFSTFTDAVAFPYQQEGHTFYVITFPTANRTFVYDLTTALWHERLYWNSTKATFEAWRPMFHAYAHAKHLTCDRLTGAIYELSLTTYTDVGGVAIRRVRRAPHLNVERKNVFVNRFEIDLENGVGLAAGQGSDPEVMFRISRDGGRTFGTELVAKAGKMGEYTKRAVWRRLGKGRDLVFEIAVSDPVPWHIVDAYVEAEVGLS